MGSDLAGDLAGEAFAELRRPAVAHAAVVSMIGYRTPPAAGDHRGLPSPYLTLVFSLAGRFPITVPADAGPRPGSFVRPVGGLHTRAVLLPRRLPQAPDVAQRGVQLAVHPLAARAVFGMPASALVDRVVELDDVIGPTGMFDDLPDTITGIDAAGVVTRWLDGRLRRSPAPAPAAELVRAWRLIVGSGGRLRIADVATDVGWSRRHLTTRMRAEIGVGAKDLARLARFHRSHRLIGRRDRDLGRVAADSGYADQSHLTAEWREFAGLSPARWAADELGSK